MVGKTLINQQYYHHHIPLVTLCSRSVKQSHYPWAAERFKSSLLTVQGKPNTHARSTNGSPQATFPLSSQVVDQGHPLKYMAPRTTDGAGSCQHVHLPRNKFKRVGKSPLAGPIRYRAYRLPYSRYVVSTFKRLTTCTTHCGLSTFSLNRRGLNHKYHPMTPPVNLMIAVCDKTVRSYNLASSRKLLDFYRS